MPHNDQENYVCQSNDLILSRADSSPDWVASLKNGARGVASDGFVVFDLETTGINPKRSDRIVEIGVVHVSREGEVTEQWQSLLNPERDLGPTRIHGIRGADVHDAPRFSGIADHLRELLDNRTIVAHNASFDTRFLLAEWERAGLVDDSNLSLSALCTMQLASKLIPGAGRSLADCCAAFDIPNDNAHSALSDARATASLLSQYMRLPGTSDVWDSSLSSGFDSTRIRTYGQRSAPYPRSLAESAVDAASSVPSERPRERWSRVVADLPDMTVNDENERDYLALLDKSLSDYILDIEEAMELAQLASDLGLERSRSRQLESQFFDQVVAAAWEDGELTAAEKEQLHQVALALTIAESRLSEALKPRFTPTVSAYPAIEPDAVSETFSVGAMIVLTGDMRVSREVWTQRLSQAGYVVHPAVTKKVDLVVAEDVDSLSGKAQKARKYGIPILSEDQMESFLASGRTSDRAAQGVN